MDRRRNNQHINVNGVISTMNGIFRWIAPACITTREQLRSILDELIDLKVLPDKKSKVATAGLYFVVEYDNVEYDEIDLPRLNGYCWGLTRGRTMNHNSTMFSCVN